jgi:hypothetical protein
VTERKTKSQAARRDEQRKSADEAAARRQRARDRVGEEGLPRSTGAPRRRGGS